MIDLKAGHAGFCDSRQFRQRRRTHLCGDRQPAQAAGRQVGPGYDDAVEDYLYSEDYVVYAAANHRLAGRKRLMLADLVQERWVLASITDPGWQRLKQAFAAIGLPAPNVAIETTDMSLRQHMVSRSDLLAFASRNTARSASANYRIAELRVKDLAYTRRVGAVYRKDAYLSPAARRFIEILKKTAKEIVAEKR